MKSPKAEELSFDSRSAMCLRAATIVSDLHHRAPSDVPALLRDLVEGAAESLPGAQYCGVMVSRRRRLAETAVATHRYVEDLDSLENRSEQGPCQTAATSQSSVRVDDLQLDARWPRYRREAVTRTPIRSVLSIGMLKEGTTASSLNFYAEQPRAFDDSSEDMGLIFASHAALVWNMMRRDQQFRAALVSRDVIGQAKGRMMERFNIDATEAFDMLKLMSQDSNTPLAELARRVVTGRVWPASE